jgi:eukaryotic-like serine/threonine-protein kinase
MAVTPGSDLGGYQIIALIGQGGMGVVYRAYDPSLHRFVALKLLREQDAGEVARRRRLLREARSASALNHPHICTIHEVGEADGEAFMVMELIEGRPLRDLIASDELPLQIAVKYAIEVADAMAHAHDRRILHRDLKTSNVMITADGRVKVLDFGLAQRVREQEFAGEHDSTATLEVGRVTGTLAYMAPELLEGEPADARSDVWSLGVVLYEMVTGRLPFTGRTSAELSATILREPPKPIQADVPAGLRQTIARCLCKEPVQRYQQAREVVAALEAVQSAVATRDPTSHGAEAGRAQRPGAWLWSNRRPVTTIAVAVAVAGLLGAALLWFPYRTPVRVTGNRLVISLPAGASAASFSPDGTTIVFQYGDAKDIPQLWLKNLAQGDPLPITSLELGATRPCWSPKGDQILFNHRGAIWSVPPLGGQPRLLIQQANNPSLSADGELVAYDGPERGIWLAKADGSDPRRVAVRRFIWPGTPAVSPNSQTIVFFDSEEGPMGDYWVVSASGGTPRRLTFDSSLGGRPVWTPDGRFIMLSSMRRGSETLWRVPAGGGEPEPVTLGAGQDREPAVSPDGNSLVYTNIRVAYALMLRDPVTGQQTQLLERRSPVDLPRFSPQGDRIAFFQQIEADLHLFTMNVDGREVRQLTHVAGQRNLGPQWSADGAFLFFTRFRPDVSFRKMPAAGGDSTKLGPWSVQNWAEVDPSGRAVAYARLDGTQPTATVIRDLETGSETVLDFPLRQFRWSRDGQTILGSRVLAAAGNSSWNVAQCPAGRGACRVITSGHTTRPSGDGSRIFFLRPTNPPSGYRELWSIGHDGRDEMRVGTLGRFGIDVNFDVSRDDRIVFVQYREEKAELWRADLQ